MDILKTLLVYMVMLVSSSAQLAPDTTPIPPDMVITPTPYVTKAPTPTPTLAPTATPGYTALYVGDRGENVRRLQTRLAQLGFLTDKIDGVYGQKTRKAVEDYQRANGLSIDGIAGKQTLEHLYEAYYVATPTLAPATRTPAPVTARVRVLYQSSTGQTLNSTYITCYQGVNYIYASDAFVPAGYTLSGSRTTPVTVSASGVASPATVTYRYIAPVLTQAPVEATVSVRYLDAQNQQLAAYDVVCPQGVSYISADDTYVPDGYTLVGARQTQVTVNAAGAASPSSVTFRYNAPSVTASVMVYYVNNTSGAVIARYPVTLGYGNQSITADDNRAPGYTLATARTVSVHVDKSGVATPAAVTFRYDAPAVTSIVPVTYTAASGVFYTTNVTCMQGANTIYIDYSRVPSNYSLISQGSVAVTVSANGVAKPAQVTFTFEEPPLPPMTAEVSVMYLSGGLPILASETVYCMEGMQNDIYPQDSELIAQGYIRTGASMFTVTVDANGMPSQNPVEFTYRMPWQAAVNVQYLDEDGAPIAPDTNTLCLEGVENTVTPDDAALLAAGYTRTSADSVTVTVDENGNASADTVTFTYMSPAPLETSVIVRYIDELGNQIEDNGTALCVQGVENVITPDDAALLAAGYTRTSADSVTVTVDENGNASADTVTFTYMSPAPLETSVIVRYIDELGNQIADDGTALCVQGVENVITPDDAALLAAGYTRTSADSMTVMVDENGNASADTVTFTYMSPAPLEASVIVRYIDELGNQIADDGTALCVQGVENVITPDDAALLAAGYTRTSADSVTVTVDENGSASADTVTFTYMSPAPLEASVIVRYIDELGNQIADDGLALCVQGVENVITPDDAALLAAGYTRTSADSVTVTVDENGNANADTVTFTYMSPAPPAPVVEAVGQMLTVGGVPTNVKLFTNSNNELLVPFTALMQAAGYQSSLSVTVGEHEIVITLSGENASISVDGTPIDGEPSAAIAYEGEAYLSAMMLQSALGATITLGDGVIDVTLP